MKGFKKLLSPAGGVSVGVICLVAIAAWVLKGYIRGDVPDSAYYTTYICAVTKKPYVHRNAEGDTYPLYSPYSGKNTGYVAELCYWNADGTVRDKPTPVLLNAAAGIDGPTFCPDCGRLVVGHNPKPKPGARPPATKDEYERRLAAQ